MAISTPRARIGHSFSRSYVADAGLNLTIADVAEIGPRIRSLIERGEPDS